MTWTRICRVWSMLRVTVPGTLVKATSSPEFHFFPLSYPCSTGKRTREENLDFPSSVLAHQTGSQNQNASLHFPVQI